MLFHNRGITSKATTRQSAMKLSKTVKKYETLIMKSAAQTLEPLTSPRLWIEVECHLSTKCSWLRVRKRPRLPLLQQWSRPTTSRPIMVPLVRRARTTIEHVGPQMPTSIQPARSTWSLLPSVTLFRAPSRGCPRIMVISWLTWHNLQWLLVLAMASSQTTIETSQILRS